MKTSRETIFSLALLVIISACSGGTKQLRDDGVKYIKMPHGGRMLGPFTCKYDIDCSSLFGQDAYCHHAADDMVDVYGQKFGKCAAR